MSFSVDYSNAKHAALAQADIGDDAEFVIKTTTGADEETVIYLRGSLSAIMQQNPSGDVAMMSVGLAFVQKPQTFHHP